MKILVINSWSSSLKYQLIDMEENKLLAKWNIEKIWIGESILTHKINWKKIKINKEVTNHKEALSLALKMLYDWEFSIISWLGDIDAIWHRVVHGWEHFSEPVIIDKNVIGIITECEKLAPLHNPENKKWILACSEIMPDKPQVAVFDTSFHQTISQEQYLYAIPYEFYKKYHIRKYGFHWISHKYISQRLSEIEKENKSKKIITCHVWNGASISAIKDGKVVDTSMGFTPLEWLIMWTRSWSIDPSIISFLIKNEWLSADEIDNILNKKSWVLGISWISSDMREIEDWFLAKKEKESLALKMYIDKIIKYIWSYVALMNWIDTIIFTAWVLENSPVIRKLIVDKLSYLWAKLNEEENNFRWEEKIISTQDSKVKIIVIPTNEEYMIAKDTHKLVLNMIK